MPRETRSAYDTFSLPIFPGFELQFYLLLLSSWKENEKKKQQDFLMLAVVLSKKRYRFQILVQNK